jgi:pimeloyl-ACP methyl ester carboxylesterase
MLPVIGAVGPEQDAVGHAAQDKGMPATLMEDTVATFLFVPGAWHGGWAFDSLAGELSARGHKVIAPDLPLGPQLPTLARWARFIVSTARESGEKVVLAGHSRGGLVVSAAAELDPEAFESLVYIAAFLVPDGHSAEQFLAATPRLEAFDRGLRVSEDGNFLILSQEAAVTSMAHRCATRYLEEFAPRLQPDPIEPLKAVMALSAERFGSLRKAYVECTEDLALQTSIQRDMQVAQPCDRVYSLVSDHTPMLSAIEPLADALDDWVSVMRSTSAM